MLDLSFGPFLYAGLSLVAGAIFGYRLIRASKPKAVLMLGIGHVLGGLWLYLTAHAGAGLPEHSGMTAAIKILALVLLVIPSAVGLGLGAATGWWRGPRPKVE